MKNLFFTSLIFTVFSGISIAAFAQKNKHIAHKVKRESVALPVKFIEGIEIKRNVLPQSEPANAIVPDKVPVTGTVNGDIEKILPVQFKYAQLLDCNVEAVKNIPLFNFIDDWWETHYSYGGSTRSGVDCSAFAGLLFTKVYATEIPRTARDQYSASEKLEREKLTEGDLVFFNTRGGVSHVGIYLAQGYFVHASTTSGVTINNLEDDYYSARFLGGGRISPASADGVVKSK